MLQQTNTNTYTRNTTRHVFIDTSALLAGIIKNDDNHDRAEKLLNKLQEEKYIFCLTPYIIAETHAGILRVSSNIKLAGEWLTQSAYHDFLILRPTKEMEHKAASEILQYQDKDYSFADMISFEIMQEYSVNKFASFDGHFEQIGKFQNIENYLYD